jgi:pimeloyl-ACP methyl ester carboxylesterase
LAHGRNENSILERKSAERERRKEIGHEGLLIAALKRYVGIIHAIESGNTRKTIVTKAFISPTEWQDPAQYFPHRSHRIFYKLSPQHADAPALVLIHGFPTSSWDWSPLWSTLAQRFALVAPDLIGFGLSAKPQQHAYSILDQADLIEALLVRLNITHYHLLAHDYGDTVAQELIARAHDGSARAALQSAVLLNGGLFPETHRPRITQRLLASPLGKWVAKQMTREKFGEAMTAIFGSGTPPSRQELDAMWHYLTANEGLAVMPELIRYMAERKRYRTRWVGALTHAGRNRIPVRLICGADDPVSGRHMAARYRELVPDADIVLLNGIGHYPQVEATESVLSAFMGFHDVRVNATR